MKALGILMLTGAVARAQGPAIELPVEADKEPSKEPGREAGEPTALGSGRRIPIGSYGEAFYVQSDQKAEEAVLKRVVLFLGHAIDEQWRLYSEIEVEGEEDGSVVEMEQAFAEYRHGAGLGVRAGLLLVPVGIVNVMHESPTFFGNERPLLDRVLVPTTWRELGAGVFGSFGPVRYEAYLMRGLDASGFAADRPIRGGRLGGNEGSADTAAGVIHLGWTPLQGLDLGGSAYYGDASQGDDALDVRVTLVEADARLVRSGFEARAQFASLSISGTDDLALVRTGDPEADPVPADSTSGFYTEVGYDVLHLWQSKQALSPFFRYERIDLGAPDPTQILQGGIQYRPRPELAFKGDLASIDVGKTSETRLALGFGFMF